MNLQSKLVGSVATPMYGIDSIYVASDSDL